MDDDNEGYSDGYGNLRFTSHSSAWDDIAKAAFPLDAKIDSEVTCSFALRNRRIYDSMTIQKTKGISSTTMNPNVIRNWWSNQSMGWSWDPICCGTMTWSLVTTTRRPFLWQWIKRIPYWNPESSWKFRLGTTVQTFGERTYFKNNSRCLRTGDAVLLQGLGVWKKTSLSPQNFCVTIPPSHRYCLHLFWHPKWTSRCCFAPFWTSEKKHRTHTHTNPPSHTNVFEVFLTNFFFYEEKPTGSRYFSDSLEQRYPKEPSKSRGLPTIWDLQMRDFPHLRQFTKG